MGMRTVYQVYPDTGRGLLAQFVSLSAAGSASSPESDPLPEPKACVEILILPLLLAMDLAETFPKPQFLRL